MKIIQVRMPKGLKSTGPLVGIKSDQLFQQVTLTFLQLPTAELMDRIWMGFVDFRAANVV
jgi:hypothetical protein